MSQAKLTYDELAARYAYVLGALTGVRSLLKEHEIEMDMPPLDQLIEEFIEAEYPHVD